MKNKLDVNVSLFKTVKDSNPVEVNLYELFKSEKYRKSVEAIRAESDKDKQTKMKIAMPCYTPSGVFSNGSDKSLQNHTGLLALDLDLKDNSQVENFKDLKKLIKSVPYVAYCGLSIRGEGYYVLISISSPLKHREHFASLEKDFGRCGLVVDPACINVGRKRFVSFDSDPYVNLEPETYCRVIETVRPLNQSGGEVRTPEDKASIAVEVARIIATICNQRLDITGNYKSWYEIACSLANEFGENGRAMFQAVSQFHPDYDYDLTDNKFDEAIRGEYNYTIGTFFHYAKLYSITAMLDFNGVHI